MLMTARQQFSFYFRLFSVSINQKGFIGVMKNKN